MNRTVVLGIAIFFAVVGLALVAGQQTAVGGDCGGCSSDPCCGKKGLFNRCGGCHADKCSGKCSGDSCSGKCHGRDKCCGLFGRKCCGGKSCSGACSGGCSGCGGKAAPAAGGGEAPPPPPAGGTTSVERAPVVFHAVSFRR